MSWYAWWISNQIALLPPNLLSVLPVRDDVSTAKPFMELWRSLGSFMSTNAGASIDDMAQHLLSMALIEDKKDNESASLIKSLIFTIVGWQTMLFRADCGSCPPTYFAIANEMNGHKGRVHMKLKQSQTSSRESLDRCLLGFGVLLSPKNCDLSSSLEHEKAFLEYKDIESSELNAALLMHIAQLELRWTDCLACHLELDLSSGRLYLFRYPSFCKYSRASEQDQEKLTFSPIHACARQKSGSSQWATTSEVTDFLDEVIMSYRLLFGQDKKSRKLFRSLSPFAGTPTQAYDQLLLDICGHKHCSSARLPRAERKHWDLVHDFPILRSRLSTLAYELSIRKPRSWGALWKDKRDSAQWATFWTVIIFGLISLLLSLIQVILQAVQLATQKG